MGKRQGFDRHKHGLSISRRFFQRRKRRTSGEKKFLLAYVLLMVNLGLVPIPGTNRYRQRFPWD